MHLRKNGIFHLFKGAVDVISSGPWLTKKKVACPIHNIYLSNNEVVSSFYLKGVDLLQFYRPRIYHFYHFKLDNRHAIFFNGGLL